MESPEMISPSSSWAKRMPQWLLPVAVGPVITITLGLVSMIPPDNSVFYLAVAAALDFLAPRFSNTSRKRSLITTRGATRRASSTVSRPKGACRKLAAGKSCWRNPHRPLEHGVQVHHRKRIVRQLPQKVFRNTVTYLYPPQGCQKVRFSFTVVLRPREVIL